MDAFTFVSKDDDDLTPVTRENLSLDDLKRTWMGKMQWNLRVYLRKKTRKILKI